MKLVIQLPCHNEAAQLPATLLALPRKLDGFESVEWLVVDDGSTDGTAEVARVHGATHIVRIPERRGLSHAFSVGIETALRAGADVIVNTDGDNQYCADDIGALVAPILARQAQIVVGARPIAEIASFTLGKKWLQRVGSAVVRALSDVAVPDATSGFRAYAREAALVLNVFSRYTYTLETLVQAGRRRLVVRSVPVRVNPPTRRSRLAHGSADYVLRAMVSIVHAYVIYRPFRFFAIPGLTLALGGLLVGLRFTWYFAAGGGTAGHVQSLILAAVLVVLAGILGAIGIIAELIAINRRLLEEIQANQRRREWGRL